MPLQNISEAAPIHLHLENDRRDILERWFAVAAVADAEKGIGLWCGGQGASWYTVDHDTICEPDDGCIVVSTAGALDTVRDLPVPVLPHREPVTIVPNGQKDFAQLRHSHSVRLGRLSAPGCRRELLNRHRLDCVLDERYEPPTARSRHPLLQFWVGRLVRTGTRQALERRQTTWATAEPVTILFRKKPRKRSPSDCSLFSRPPILGRAYPLKKRCRKSAVQR